MAAFIAKQVVGDKISAVTGGAKKDEEEGGEGNKDEADAEAAEIEAQRAEIEEKRKEKHRKMEEEREGMRQGIRDKYGLKKKEEIVEEAEAAEPPADGRIGRKKKTPAELAAEASKDEEDEDEFAKFPTNLSELSTKVGEIPAKMAAGIGEVTEKCTLQ